MIKNVHVRKNNGQKKIASIGQAVMQATRPRVILTPLQLGLGVQLHHHFGSRFLIGTLHQHVRTSDGSDTFHGMGMITIVTLRNKNTNQILRMKVTPEDTAAVGRVPV